MAHSAELAIYAISARAEVGVDLERIRSLEHISLIASQFFSPREQAALHTLSEEDQLYGFFDCWTRKEALIKAFGGAPPDLEKGREASQVRYPSASQEISHRWSLRSISPAPGYIAAVAVDSPTAHFSYWRWPDPRRSFFPGTAWDSPGRFRNS
jgi:4'-phosphopantetheinyl transferase